MKGTKKRGLYGGEPKAVAMRGLLAELECSGLTQKVFAQRHGMSVAGLHYWKRRFRGGENPQLLEVEPVALAKGGAMRIELPGNIIIHWEGTLPVEALVQLSRALS